MEIAPVVERARVVETESMDGSARRRYVVEGAPEEAKQAAWADVPVEAGAEAAALLETPANDAAGRGWPEVPPRVAAAAGPFFRGLGQVVFCDAPASGPLVLMGLLHADPAVAAFACLGDAAATAAARALALDADARDAGLLGYDGALVGCAFGVFLRGAWFETGVATVAGATCAAALSVPLRRACAPTPAWTFGFNVPALAALAIARPLAGAAAPRAACACWYAWMRAPLAGLSQIYVVDDAVCGAFILLAIAAHSRACALSALAGSAVGGAVGAAVGATAGEVSAGLYGFNSALCALAVSVFFAPTPAAHAVALSAAAAAAVAFGALKAVFGVFGIPTCTLPFCLVASAVHQLHHGVPALRLADAGSARVGAWLDRKTRLPEWFAAEVARRRSSLFGTSPSRWDQVRRASAAGAFAKGSPARVAVAAAPVADA